MRYFTAAELAEIRRLFRQRIATLNRTARPKPQPKPQPRPIPALVREPDFDEAEVLKPAEVAELFAVSRGTVEAMG
jgi:hypothetical protein